MNKLLKNFLVVAISLSSLGAFGKVKSDSMENIRLSVNVDVLKCEMSEIYAGGGSVVLPIGSYSTSKIKNTKFKHTKFTGQAYLPNDVSCGPIDDIISSAAADGKVKVKKNTKVYVLTYQTERGGPVTSVETIEKVRLTFSNGIYLESSKSVTTKK